jgi:hypothetical protein
MEDVAADQTERALEVERAVDLAAEDLGFVIRCVLIDRLDHEIGDLLTMQVP